MIFYRFLSILLTLVLGTCTINANNVQGKTMVSVNHGDTHCLNIRRPLNPSATPQRSETALESYFRLAYNAEVGGDFDTAIINYRKAAKQATCNCDKLHAQAGEQAAKEAKTLLKTDGLSSKPTQFFWSRLQELTKSLSCVTTQ